MLIASITCFEIEIKDAKSTTKSASYFDIHTKIYSDGMLRTKHDKIYYFNFPIVNFPFICSKSPAYISQLIRYSRAHGS